MRNHYILLVPLLIMILFQQAAWSVAMEVPAPNQVYCPQLSPPAGLFINVSTVAELKHAVHRALPGTTIFLADGSYDLSGASFALSVPNVTLRSATGNRNAVILDGNYETREIFQIMASDVTIADVTLQKATAHSIHVMSSQQGDTLNTRIYNVHIIDPGQQAIKINPAADGFFTDYGEIACSYLELTDEGRQHIRNNCYTGGIDAHQSRGWLVRDNLIEGFWCSVGLSEHAIHFWRGSRDTVIERNLIRDNARGIGVGLVTDGMARTYTDDPCKTGDNYVDHYGGVIKDNQISIENINLLSSREGADCGICIWQACQVRVENNQVYSADPERTFSSIEWRFPLTSVTLKNNLVNVQMHERNGAKATVQ